MLGLIGKKVGMTQVFDDNGILTPVTVIKVEKNTVVAERTVGKNGYDAVVLGAFDIKKSRLKKPYAGQFKEGCVPRKWLVEMRGFGKECKIGDLLGPEILQGLLFVDVSAASKGKGFQGVIKRHGFSGGSKTHGSKFHRENGSTGMAAAPSKVMKGTKMPGRMGFVRTTVQNLQIIKIDEEKQVLMVKGAVPGRKDSMVLVKQAGKK
ncbi:MAG: 50S ribosomal protein L3 [Spirochaetota bacterium]